MNTGDYMRAIVNGYLGDAGQPWTNTWTFYCSNSSNFNALQNIGEFIVPSLLAQYYAPLTSYFTSYGVVTSVNLREYGDPSGGFDWTGTYALSTSSAQPMPSFVTYSIKLGRDNYAFKPGRKGLPAVPVVAGGIDGRLLPAARTAMNVILAGWVGEWTVEADAAEYTFEPVIVHNPSDIDVVPTARSNVVSATVTGFGSQNTRK
jgi:hypothetical protein